MTALLGVQEKVSGIGMAYLSMYLRTRCLELGAYCPIAAVSTPSSLLIRTM